MYVLRWDFSYEPEKEDVKQGVNYGLLVLAQTSLSAAWTASFDGPNTSPLSMQECVETPAEKRSKVRIRGRLLGVRWSWEILKWTPWKTEAIISVWIPTFLLLVSLRKPLKGREGRDVFVRKKTERGSLPQKRKKRLIYIRGTIRFGSFQTRLLFSFFSLLDTSYFSFANAWKLKYLWFSLFESVREGKNDRYSHFPFSLKVCIGMEQNVQNGGWRHA